MKRDHKPGERTVEILDERDARIGATESITAFWLSRSNCPGRMFAGTTAKEVTATLQQEIQDDLDSGLPPDELDAITITPYETTKQEIDNLPEFEGW